jgi:ABC-2 type transport system ATP-binding protein
MSSIEVEGLTKKFGSFVAVDNLSFKIGEGEVFGLLGPNGAGKTTTIRMLACLISPSAGNARIGGYDVMREPIKVREIVGILTENPSLYERLTAYENMDFFAEAYGLSGEGERRNKIKELLSFFDLWARRNDKVGTFSKGMKQKLAVARSLIHDPPFIFLDEPTAGLDPESSKEIRDLIETLAHEKKSTILLCTHRLEDAERLSSRVMIINNGRNIIVGTPDELKQKIAGAATLEIRLHKIEDGLLKKIRLLNSVKNVELDSSHNKLLLTVDNIESSTPEIIRNIVYGGGEILSVGALYPSLEDAYLKLVKGENS